MKNNDEIFMRRALELAAEGEVPVGAVLVKDGAVIATGRNRREVGKNALAHAELEAINGGCACLGGWRLSGCTLYVTLEPCPMCAGAIVNARIRRVIVGAKDAKAGAMGSLMNVNFYPLNHHPVVEFGVLERECADILREFFLRLREKRRGK